MAELAFRLQQHQNPRPYFLLALFLLKERENKIRMYREELCVHEELHRIIKDNISVCFIKNYLKLHTSEPT